MSEYQIPEPIDTLGSKKELVESIAFMFELFKAAESYSGSASIWDDFSKNIKNSTNFENIPKSGFIRLEPEFEEYIKIPTKKSGEFLAPQFSN